MSTTTFKAFRTQALADGFDEVLEREWPPLTVLAPHVHPFAVRAVVVRGEMWLTIGAETRHLFAGDTFALDAEVTHAERYGRDGAAYWVARRN
jgi:hypothetical protein